MGMFELAQNVRYPLETIKKQIEVNLPPSTYINGINYIQAKIEEVIEILYKEI